MPIRLNHSPLHEDDEARIEIVPLIDIMFFLLAAMMLISLGAVRLKSLKAELPAVVAGDAAGGEPPFLLTVDKSGGLFLDGKPLAAAEAVAALHDLHQQHPNLRLMLAADKDTRYQDLMHAMQVARQAGIDKVAHAAEDGNPR